MKAAGVNSRLCAGNRCAVQTRHHRTHERALQPPIAAAPTTSSSTPQGGRPGRRRRALVQARGRQGRNRQEAPAGVYNDQTRPWWITTAMGWQRAAAAQVPARSAAPAASKKSRRATEALNVKPAMPSGVMQQHFCIALDYALKSPGNSSLPGLFCSTSQWCCTFCSGSLGCRSNR